METEELDGALLDQDVRSALSETVLVASNFLGKANFRDQLMLEHLKAAQVEDANARIRPNQDPWQIQATGSLLAYFAYVRGRIDTSLLRLKI